MKNKAKISIIVPIWNSEGYLRRCVDSILGQTYSDIELILVDDGSTDQSPKICDEYARKDAKVRVFHKENGGVSSARNLGMRNATGECICFVDSDDYIPLTSIADLYEGYCKNEVQCCCATKDPQVRKDAPLLISIKNEPQQLLHYLVQSDSYTVYSKLFDLNVIRANNLWFDEKLRTSEDALFIRQLFRYCSRIVLIQKTVYCRDPSNADSITKKGYAEYASNFERKLNALTELCDATALSPAETEQFLYQRAAHGLRICMYHYFQNWKAEEDRLRLTELALEIFHPWLTREGTCQKDKWVEKYLREIRQKDANAFCRSYRKEFDRQQWMLRFKRTVKKVLHR